MPHWTGHRLARLREWHRRDKLTSLSRSFAAELVDGGRIIVCNEHDWSAQHILGAWPAPHRSSDWFNESATVIRVVSAVNNDKVNESSGSATVDEAFLMAS